MTTFLLSNISSLASGCDCASAMQAGALQGGVILEANMCLRAQGVSHILTLGPKYTLYSCMDLLGVHRAEECGNPAAPSSGI